MGVSGIQTECDNGKQVQHCELQACSLCSYSFCLVGNIYFPILQIHVRYVFTERCCHMLRSHIKPSSM